MIFFRDILEFAAAEIVVEHVVAVAGDVNVRKAVVVVIADGDAHAPAARGEAGGFCDVSEMKIAVLMVERDHRIAAVEVAADGGVGDGENVELAIAIAVEERNAATHHFDQVSLIGVEVRDGGEPGLRGDVSKVKKRRGAESLARPWNEVFYFLTSCVRPSGRARADHFAFL